jgi:hypothetical protein
MDTTGRAGNVVPEAPVPTMKRWSFALLVASVFLEKVDLALEAATGGLPTPLFTAAAICFILANLRTLGRADLAKRPVAASALVLWITVLGLVTAARVVLSPSDVTGGGWPALLSYLHLLFFVVLCLAVCFAADAPSVMLAYRIIAFWAVLGVAIGVVQLVDQNLIHSGLSELLGLRSRTAAGFIRPVSVFSEPAYFGYFSLLGAAACLSFRRASWSRKGLIVFCLLGAVIPMALGPLLLLALIAVAYFFKSGISAKLKQGAMLLVILLLAASSPFFEVLQRRLEKLMAATDPSGNVRIALNEASYRLISEQPLTGIGIGESEFVFPAMVSVPGVDFVARYQAGNSYLAIAGEQGIPLAILLFVPMLLILFKRTDPGSSLEGGRVQMAVFTGSWLFVSSIGLPTFWVCYGLLLAALRTMPPSWSVGATHVVVATGEGVGKPGPAIDARKEARCALS